VVTALGFRPWGGGRLSKELEDISERVLSGEEDLESANLRERLLDLRTGFLMEGLGMLEVALEDLIVGFELGEFPELGPPISRALLTPLGSNLVTLAFTMLTA
jgi:hypothetical protein